MFLTITAAIIPFFATGDSGVEILGEGMVVNGDTDIIAVIRDGGELASRKKITPPVRITYEIETDGDVRLGYGADQIILNWSRDEKELRVNGGPVDGQHVHGGGFIPKNEKVIITQTVLANQMTISVNNVERAAWSADFQVSVTRSESSRIDRLFE